MDRPARKCKSGAFRPPSQSEPAIRERGILKTMRPDTIPPMASTGRTVATGLTDLVPKLVQAEGFAEVAAALARGESAVIDGAWGSSCALTAAALAARVAGTLLVVLSRPSDLDDFAADFCGIAMRTSFSGGFIEQKPKRGKTFPPRRIQHFCR